MTSFVVARQLTPDTRCFETALGAYRRAMAKAAKIEMFSHVFTCFDAFCAEVWLETHMELKEKR